MAQTIGRNLPPPQEPFVDSGTFNLSYSGYQYLLGLLKTASSALTTATVATGLVAKGTNQATALLLTSQWNEVENVPLNTGVLLSSYQSGQSQTVINSSGQTLFVYPPPGGTINVLLPNQPFSLSPNTRATFEFITADQIWT